MSSAPLFRACQRTAFLILITTIFTPRLHGQAVPFHSSNLPIVFIETGGQEILDEPKIPAIMGIIRGSGERNAMGDSCTDYHGPIGIELRGNSSLVYDQKQYGLETWNDEGEEENTALMGFPKEHDWVLYAPAADKSLLRNVLVYHMVREMGRYASRTRFCELVIDSVYMGVYVFMEKIKRDKNRVVVSKLEPHMEHGEELTGGYIFSIDSGGKEGDLGWSGAEDSLGYFTYWHIYPTSKNITLLQRWHIQDHVVRFESVMRGPDVADPHRGYAQWIDVPSFVDYILVNEWANNVDGFVASMYFHKDRASVNRHIVAGPVWDFNIAFGNANYADGELTSGWRSHYGRVPFWWRRLLQDPTFTERLEHRWTELRQGVLSDDHVLHVIDSLAAHLDEAQQRHFERWDFLGVFLWPNAFVGETWDEELDYLKSWTLARMAWMDEHIGSIAWTGSQGGTNRVGDPSVAGDMAIRAYPAPVRDHVTIEMHATSSISGTLVLCDMLGRELRRVDVELQSAGQHFQEFDLRHVPVGIYSVILLGADGSVTSARVTVER
ncbi:MAG: CotH kinase family protein [Bacteroidetes bacterium]|nr:CotH kinase family protein [Bacteroidota bacterium]